jgi:hypothetical protein
VVDFLWKLVLAIVDLIVFDMRFERLDVRHEPIEDVFVFLRYEVSIGEYKLADSLVVWHDLRLSEVVPSRQVGSHGSFVCVPGVRTKVTEQTMIIVQNWFQFFA